VREFQHGHPLDQDTTDSILLQDVLDGMQAADDDIRSRRKGLEMVKTVCREAPQAKLVISNSPGFLDNLTTSINHEDPLVMSSALGVLHELVDDQQALAVVRTKQGLVDSFVQQHGKLLKLTGEDREAALEEIEMSKIVAEYLT
jgi:hypothetical protein